MEKKLTDFQIENLIENVIKTKKENKLETLKKNYIKRLRESKTKKEKFRILNEVFAHRNQLIIEGYRQDKINEGWIADIFSKGLGGSWSTVKEFVYRKFLGKLNDMFGSKLDDELIEAMSIGLTNIDLTKDWRKFLSPVKNCNFFSDKILDGVIEYYINRKINQTFGQSFLGDSIRNAVSDALLNQENVQALQNVVGNIVCKTLQAAFGMGSTDQPSTAPSTSSVKPTEDGMRPSLV